MKTYSVKEIFYTLQGEGAQSGMPAVFVRFSGCNLWTGHESDRETAVCKFCDTEFVGVDGLGGGRFKSPDALAKEAASYVQPDAVKGMLLVCTGGEPLLQVDAPLIRAFKEVGFRVAVETNGTISAPDGLDWICVSPKIGAPLVQTRGSELKLVYPQDGGEPEQFETLEFDHYFLQPMDGPHRERNTGLAIDYCLRNPKWRVSLQTHKFVGLR